MLEEPYKMGHSDRAVVQSAPLSHCKYRGWELWAAHVRSNHVHVIVEADVRPERIMNELKSWASRGLNRFGSGTPGRKRWVRHGSTRWLWKDRDAIDALKYVIEGQGERMALFVSEEIRMDY